jgi:hypothetical protein
MRLPTVGEDRYGSYDVLVAGGGMAGIAAAIAAARAGAKTILLERSGWLGGLGVTGATGLHTFFNIFGAFKGAERRRVVAGIAQELVDRVQQLGGTPGHVRMERGADFVSMLTPVDPEAFRAAAARTALEAGVKLLMHSVMDEVIAFDGHVEGVIVWNKSGRTVIRAKQYVDATGDGDLAGWAGAPFEHFKKGDRGAYAAGFTFRLCNVDLAAVEADLEKRGVITQLAHAVKPGTTRPDLVRLGINMGKLKKDLGVQTGPGGFLSSSVRPREITYCNCINYGPNDGLDAEALSAAEADLRTRMFEVADFFRRHVAGCAECYPAGAAPFAGQRRGRAIHCEYELMQADCVSARRFDDDVGCYSFIDNPRDRVRDAGAYGIPYRALIPKGLSNVLVAGRMISIDLPAHNSTRNTVASLVCGQAAGTAAAMAAAGGKMPLDVDPQALREKLRAAGVLLDPRPDPL